MLLLFLFGLALGLSCSSDDYPNAALPPNFCARRWATGLFRPRGLWTASNGDILVIESTNNTITALWDDNNDGHSGPGERAILGSYPGLNHGITVHGDYLYASSPSTLVRFQYSPKDRSLGKPQVVVRNIPSDGHQTRTPRVDQSGFLFLSLGSASNIDRNPDHAEVRRFDLRKYSGPVDWKSGEVWASGLRNEVGLTFDKQGRLWGVMNGMDDLARPDLGGDIHNTNPAEELNLLDKPGKFYGYPYCWSEYQLPKYGKGKGTMWAHQDFVKDGTHTDAWCQNASNVEKPTWALNPHNAPLEIVFWYGNAFGTEYQGDAFVSLHGSWDRQPPSGYRVQRIRFRNGMPVEDTPFLWHDGASEQWPNNFRPVGLTWTSNNCLSGDCLYVSSDRSGEIVQVRHL